MFLTVALLLGATPLSEALQDYGNLDYESCVPKLSSARSGTSKERARAELVLGLCHFALGHQAAARAQLEAAFRHDPSVAPPPNVSPKEKALLEEVAAAVAAAPAPVERKVKRPAGKHSAEPHEPGEPEALKRGAEPALPATPSADPAPAMPPAEAAIARPPEAPPDAPTVTPPLVPAAATVAPAVTVVEPTPERRAGWVPFAVGGLAVAAAGTGLGLGLNARLLETQGRGAPVQVDAARLRTEAQGNALGANVAFAVAGGAAVAAVITWLVLR